MSRVFRTSAARQDLKEIGRYIALESGSREIAMRFLDVIAERCKMLGENPLMGEACEDLGTAVRRFSVGNYVLFFRPKNGGILLLRVLHGSRDVPNIWRKQ